MAGGVSRPRLDVILSRARRASPPVIWDDVQALVARIRELEGARGEWQACDAGTVRLQVKLPGWPASTNTRYRIVQNRRTGKAHLAITEDGQAWALIAGNVVKGTAADQGVTFRVRRPFTARMELQIPRRGLRRWDIDGVIKPALDVTCRVLGLNDVWCDGLQVTKRIANDFNIVVTLEQASDE